MAFEVPHGVMITDGRGVIERVNPAFTRITGYGAGEVVGRNARLLQSGRHDRAFYAAMFGAVRATGWWQGEVWNRRKSGEVYPEWLTVSAVHDDRGALAHYVGTMQDISLRKSREQAIEQLAFRDPLTGLPNRRLLIDRLQQAMAVSARARREGALMFIDLDHFKDVNDTLGHDRGDELLRQVAERLTGCVRECDTVARLGGDEFVVMLAADLSAAGDAAAAQTRLVGEKILAALGRPFQLAGQPGHGNASIGVALFSNHQVDADELLHRADQAMYQAKAAGRNTLRFYDEAIQQSLQRRAALEGQLRQALQRGEFVLHYQPEVDRERRLLGTEALLRWQHPQRGLLLPADFIAVADDCGLIHALGRWVRQTACAQLAAWAGQPGLAGLTLSVNVGAREFGDERFVPQLLELLDRSGADAARLEIELSGHALQHHCDDAVARMNSLRARRRPHARRLRHRRRVAGLPETPAAEPRQARPRAGTQPAGRPARRRHRAHPDRPEPRPGAGRDRRRRADRGPVRPARRPRLRRLPGRAVRPRRAARRAAPDGAAAPPLRSASPRRSAGEIRSGAPDALRACMAPPGVCEPSDGPRCARRSITPSCAAAARSPDPGTGTGSGSPGPCSP